MALLLALHELVCAKSQTAAQTNDHERICDREEREVLTERKVLCVQARTPRAGT